MPLKLMYITNDPAVALAAQKHGVDRVWIDLETLGKEERQKGMNTVKSRHTVDDVRRIKALLATSEMLVRINHWHERSAEEIEAVLAAGADMIMLPYWKTAEEVGRFSETVSGRCKTTLLLETKEAAACLDEVLTIPGIDEIHIGLNDLHLSLGLTFMFELLTNGTVETLCGKIADAGLPYGFGGIAKIGAGDVPAEMIILEHYRLGSTRAILSRSFFSGTSADMTPEEIDRAFGANMTELRNYEAWAASATEEVFSRNREDLRAAVERVVHRKRKSGD